MDFNNTLHHIDSVHSDEKSEEERKKRPRTAFTAAQIKSLEAEFERNKYLSVAKRCQLSKNLKLTETQVTFLRYYIPITRMLLKHLHVVLCTFTL